MIYVPQQSRVSQPSLIGKKADWSSAFFELTGQTGGWEHVPAGAAGRKEYMRSFAHRSCLSKVGVGLWEWGLRRVNDRTSPIVIASAKSDDPP